MGWADYHIERLERGETVRFCPRGKSMTGRVEDGQLVTVDPELDDVVLCTVKGHQYLHLVRAIRRRRDWSEGTGYRYRYQIASNTGRINGWINLTKIHGVMTEVED